MNPEDSVRCKPLSGSMPASCCVLRHLKRLTVGPARSMPAFPFCAACWKGADRLKRLVSLGWKPAFPRHEDRMAQYRAAKLKWHREHTAHEYQPAVLEDP